MSLRMDGRGETWCTLGEWRRREQSGQPSEAEDIQRVISGTRSGATFNSRTGYSLLTIDLEII